MSAAAGHGNRNASTRMGDFLIGDDASWCESNQTRRKMARDQTRIDQGSYPRLRTLARPGFIRVRLRRQSLPHGVQDFLAGKWFADGLSGAEL